MSLAQKVPADHVIVEIGAYLGKSTCYLATGSKEGNEARVISIDAWDTPGNHHGPNKHPGMYVRPTNFTQYQQHLAACGVADLVYPVKAFSSEAPFPKAPIGLLWIDGAHDYAGVRGDVNRWSPLVAPGGHIVIDDYTVHCPDVVRCVDEMTADEAWTGWNFAHKPIVVGTKL